MNTEPSLQQIEQNRSAARAYRKQTARTIIGVGMVVAAVTFVIGALPDYEAGEPQLALAWGGVCALVTLGIVFYKAMALLRD